jgi:hypothetical protein
VLGLNQGHGLCYRIGVVVLQGQRHREAVKEGAERGGRKRHERRCVFCFLYHVHSCLFVEHGEIAQGKIRSLGGRWTRGRRIGGMGACVGSKTGQGYKAPAAGSQKGATSQCCVHWVSLGDTQCS